MYLIHDKFNYWFDIKEIQEMKDHVEEFMVPTSEEQLVQVYFSPIQPDQPGAEFLTLAEIAAKITVYGNLHKNIDPRQLGTIMKKLGFVALRKGHKSTRGYVVLEHTPNDIEKKRDPNMP